MATVNQASAKEAATKLASESIRQTKAYKVANKLAKVNPNAGREIIASISAQVGNTETVVEALKSKLKETTSTLSNLQQLQPNPALYTVQQTRKLLFINRTVQSLIRRVSSLNRRLTNLKKLPERLANAALTILGAATVIKAIPIPGVSLTAGATSTFSGTLEDVRGKGRTLLNNAQAIDSLVDTSAIESFQQELEGVQQKVTTLVETLESPQTLL